MSGAPWRQLPCGCWQCLLAGDIVTSKTKVWVTVMPCDEHGAATRASEPGLGQ